MASRKNIREAVKTLLVADPAINGFVADNVFSNRITALFRGVLPSISIYGLDEAATPRNIQKSSYIRVLNLQITVQAEAKEGLDDVLDSIGDAIEAVMEANPSLSATCTGHTLQGVNIEMSDAVVPVGMLSLNYEVTYIK